MDFCFQYALLERETRMLNHFYNSTTLTVSYSKMQGGNNTYILFFFHGKMSEIDLKSIEELLSDMLECMEYGGLFLILEIRAYHRKCPKKALKTMSVNYV